MAPTVTVVSASTADERYVPCIPHFIDFWKAANSRISGVQFEPLVYLVSDFLPVFLAGYANNIELFDTNLDKRFVAQNIRALACGLSPSEFSMTSDIDMLQLDSRALDLGLKKLLGASSAFLVLRDVLPDGQFPICYSLARTSTWREVTRVTDADELHGRLDEIWLRKPGNYSGTPGGPGWFTDQEVLWSDVVGRAQSHRLEVIRLTDAETKHQRLDRGQLGGRIKWVQSLLVPFGYYTDYHVHHPVKKYQRFIRWALFLHRLRNGRLIRGLDPGE